MSETGNKYAWVDAMMEPSSKGKYERRYTKTQLDGPVFIDYWSGRKWYTVEHDGMRSPQPEQYLPWRRIRNEG